MGDVGQQLYKHLVFNKGYSKEQFDKGLLE
jgi:hypothetical protein